MAAKQVNPTRMELTRLKKKRITAIRGHKLLKDKRDELMRQYLDLVRENMEVRKKVEAGIRSANRNFVIAKAGMSEAALNTALLAPKQEITLEAGGKNVMSVDIPTFEYKTRTADENDIYSFLWICIYIQRPGRSGEIPCGYPAGHDPAGGVREGMPAHGGGDRKNKKACKRAGACDHSGDGGEH